MITYEELFKTDQLQCLDMTSVDINRNNFGIINIDDFSKSKGLIYIQLLPNKLDNNLEFMEVNINDNKFIISIYNPIYIVSPKREVMIGEKEILYNYTKNNWNYIMNIFKELYNIPYNIKILKESNSINKINNIIWPDKSPDYRLLPDCKE